MSSPVNIIKENVRALRAYSLKAERTHIKLNQNENPWDAPQAIKQETLRRLEKRPWSRYPDFAPQSLHDSLARFSGWIPEGILTGNGSNELIQALLMVTVGAGTRVVINEPTFALYRQITTVLGGDLISVPLNSNFSYDVDSIKRKTKSDLPQVTIICSPNNPTGCVIEKDELVSLLVTSPGLIVIDEAYHEFSGESVVPLLNKYSNLVVLRTFSKAMAMAGLRVGYLLAAPALTREIAKALLPYNLNIVSQTAAQVAIEQYEFSLQPLIDLVCSERERLFNGLNEIKGLEPVRSRANFMIVRSAIKPGSVFEELLERDILIRDVSGYPQLSDYFRISVGTPDENNQLLEALREICSTEN